MRFRARSVCNLLQIHPRKVYRDASHSKVSFERGVLDLTDGLNHSWFTGRFSRPWKFYAWCRRLAKNPFDGRKHAGDFRCAIEVRHKVDDGSTFPECVVKPNILYPVNFEGRGTFGRPEWASVPKVVASNSSRLIPQSAKKFVKRFGLGLFAVHGKGGKENIVSGQEDSWSSLPVIIIAFALLRLRSITVTDLRQDVIRVRRRVVAFVFLWAMPCFMELAG